MLVMPVLVSGTLAHRAGDVGPVRRVPDPSACFRRLVPAGVPGVRDDLDLLPAKVAPPAVLDERDGSASTSWFTRDGRCPEFGPLHGSWRTRAARGCTPSRGLFPRRSGPGRTGGSTPSSPPPTRPCSTPWPRTRPTGSTRPSSGSTPT